MTDFLELIPAARHSFAFCILRTQNL